MSVRRGDTARRIRVRWLPLVAALVVLGCWRRRPVEPSGALRVAVPYDLVSLDPHLDNSLEQFSQLSNVYESLVALDGDLRLVPGLAVSWSNPDATTWAFRLRPGVRFHDGRPLTAQDVVFSIMRLKKDPTLEVRMLLSEVTGASVENGEAVLRTGRPSARLLTDLSWVLVVPAGSRHESLDAHPNGTGPYAIESWTRGRRLRLRRHEAYWGPRPAHPRVEVEMGVTDERTAAGLREGRLSIAGGLPAAERAASGNPRYRLVRQPSPFLWHLGFDLSSRTLPGTAGVPNPFLHLEVRQAIDLALDRDRIAAAGSTSAVPARHIVPRFVFGHDPGGPPSTRDVAKARRLLEAAGYRNGFDVTLHFRSANPDPRLQELKAQLAEIGVRVTLAATPGASDFFASLRRRELGFWLVAHGSVTGEAGSVLSEQFHSPDPVRNLGLDNTTGYANAALDRAIEEADAIYDPRARLPALQNAVRLVEDAHLWIPLYYNNVLFIADRALAFEPRKDLLLRYAEIGRAGAR